jgi:hypothetical protein
MNFKNYLKIIEQNTVGTHNDFATAAFATTDFTGSETFPTQTLGVNLPSIDLIVPNTVRRSEITHLEINKNPIFCLLKDGTKLYFSWDEYIRIGKPKIGQILNVTFEKKYLNEPSKIIKIELI